MGNRDRDSAGPSRNPIVQVHARAHTLLAGRLDTSLFETRSLHQGSCSMLVLTLMTPLTYCNVFHAELYGRLETEDAVQSLHCST